MYVETDFLTALAKDEDWLQEPALRAIDEHDELHTSILSYAELLVLLYERENDEYDIDVSRAVANLLEFVPIEPEVHEEAVLAAAGIIEEFQLAPFDALHAGVVANGGASVLSSETDCDRIGLDRVPLAPDE